MHEAELAGLHQSTAQGLLVGDHNSLLNNMAGGNNIFDTRRNNRPFRGSQTANYFDSRIRNYNNISLM